MDDDDDEDDGDDVDVCGIFLLVVANRKLSSCLVVDEPSDC